VYEVFDSKVLNVICVNLNPCSLSFVVFLFLLKLQVFGIDFDSFPQIIISYKII